MGNIMVSCRLSTLEVEPRLIRSFGHIGMKMSRDTAFTKGFLEDFGGITLWLFNIAIENASFIDGLPINSMVIFHSYVSLPEGIFTTHRLDPHQVTYPLVD